jgi:hypothetical protein
MSHPFCERVAWYDTVSSVDSTPPHSILAICTFTQLPAVVGEAPCYEHIMLRPAALRSRKVM